MLHALDVVIGLAAVYTAFSLLASWINETFNSWTKLRARTLESGIAQMVGDETLHTSLYGQPSIQAARGVNERAPSYLSSKQFSLAVMSLIKAGTAIGLTGQAAISSIEQSVNALGESRLKQVLLAILVQCDSKVESFVSGVETWFDSEMDRVSGWYKRNAQIWLFVIGVILAAAFNVDSIRYAYNFASKPLVIDNCNLQGDTTKAQQCVSTNVFAQIPVGWWNAAYCPQTQKTTDQPCRDEPSQSSVAPSWWFWKIAGLLTTAIALSLGAPFWFDTLTRFVNLRNAGPSPQKTSGQVAP